MPAGEAPAAAAGEVDEGSNERPSLGSFGADAAPPGSPKLKKGRGEVPRPASFRSQTVECTAKIKDCSRSRRKANESRSARLLDHKPFMEEAIRLDNCRLDHISGPGVNTPSGLSLKPEQEQKRIAAADPGARRKIAVVRRRRSLDLARLGSDCNQDSGEGVINTQRAFIDELPPTLPEWRSLDSGLGGNSRRS